MPVVRLSCVRVLVADRHPVFREGLISALCAGEGMEFVGQAGGLEELFEHLRSTAPTIVIVDGGMLDRRFLPELYGRCDAIKAGVLVIAPPWSAPFVGLLAEGLIGSCILRTVGKDELVEAVQRLAKGERVRSKAVAEYLSAVTPNLLTARDRAVLALASEGRANASIAGELRLSLSCVNTQMRNVRRKLGARDRTHAVTLGLKHGLLEIG